MSGTFQGTDGALYFDQHGDVWRYLDGQFVHVKRANENTPDPSVNRWVEDAASIAASFGPMRHLADRMAPTAEALLLWALQDKDTTDDDVLHRAHTFVEQHRAEARREVLGDELNPSRLVTDAKSYRYLADEVLATMTDADRWDLDGSEEWILAQYVKHIAAQLVLASEFRVPLPEGLGGCEYGELVVQREATGSDRWAVTDGAATGLQAYIDGAGWRYVSDVGRAEAFSYTLDEALHRAEYEARSTQEQHDAAVRAAYEDGES